MGKPKYIIKVGNKSVNGDYGQTNVPPLPSFLPLNDKECTNPCQYVYHYLRYN